MRAGTPAGPFDVAGAMGSLGIDDEPRRTRRMSATGRSRPSSPSGINYGPTYGGANPGDSPRGYVRERTISNSGNRPGDILGVPYPGAAGPGMVPGPAFAGAANGVGVMPVPGGGIMPDRARTPYGGSNGGSNRSYPASPSRVPISQIPPSPNSNINNLAPMYGGAPSGASPYAQPGTIPNGPPGLMANGAMPTYSNPAAPGGMPFTQGHPFTREPNPVMPYAPFPSFDIVTDMDELLELLPEVPPLPAALVSHDVLHEDWARYMSVS